jgi:hypothetical protein
MQDEPGWCGHGFSNHECNALDKAIGDLMNSKNYICSWLGFDAYDAFNANNITFAGPEEVDRLYANGNIKSRNVGGITDPDMPATEITYKAFSPDTYETLTTTIAHEMVHYNGLDLARNGGDLPAGQGGPTVAYAIGAACRNP